MLTIALLMTAGCRKQPAQIKRLQWCTMGTIAAVQSTDLTTAQKMRDIAQDEFAVMDKELSSWTAASTLSTVNSNAGKEGAIPVSASLSIFLTFPPKSPGRAAGLSIR